MVNICQCGSSAGYPHATDCPYPCFYLDDESTARWVAARDARGAKTFTVNQRVTATLYGERKRGTVTRIGRSPSIVFVRWDGTRYEQWQHAVSLIPA